MRRVQIQFTDEQAATLHERARASGRSVTAVVRDAVDAWLAGQERERRWDRALEAIGAGDSGLGDVAENHDRYLNENPRW